jgi:hypothetical protein
MTHSRFRPQLETLEALVLPSNATPLTAAIVGPFAPGMYPQQITTHDDLPEDWLLGPLAKGDRVEARAEAKDARATADRVTLQDGEGVAPWLRGQLEALLTRVNNYWEQELARQTAAANRAQDTEGEPHYAALLDAGQHMAARLTIEDFRASLEDVLDWSNDYLVRVANGWQEEVREDAVTFVGIARDRDAAAVGAFGQGFDAVFQATDAYRQADGASRAQAQLYRWLQEAITSTAREFGQVP